MHAVLVIISSDYNPVRPKSQLPMLLRKKTKYVLRNYYTGSYVTRDVKYCIQILFFKQYIHLIVAD